MASTSELFWVQPARCSASNIKNAATSCGVYRHPQVRASLKADQGGPSNQGMLWKAPSSLRKSSSAVGCRQGTCTLKFSAAEVQPVSASKTRRKKRGTPKLHNRESQGIGRGEYLPTDHALCLPVSAAYDTKSEPTSGAVEEPEINLSLEPEDTRGQSVIGTTLDGIRTLTSQVPIPLFLKLRIAKRWAEISGAKNWDGLLHPRPIDEHLAGELLRYGEFAKATYDALDQNTESRYCGSCKKGKKRLLEFLGLENRGYRIVRYIYCTSTIDLPKFFCKPAFTPDEEKWSKDSNWMGFIAVCTDKDEIARLGRRDVLVAWRGTVTYGEWLGNLKTSLRPTESVGQGKRRNLKLGSGEPKVESGFWSMYTSKKEGSRFNQTSAAEQVLDVLTRIMDKYRGEELSVTITGHSLGGALAILSARDIALKIKKAFGEGSTALPIPVTVYSFGAPRVGNNAFRDQVLGLGVKVLRVVNVHDIVPRLPGLLLTEIFRFLVDCAPNCVKDQSIVKHLYQLSKTWFIFKFIHKLVDQFPSTYCHIGQALKVDNLLSSPLRCRTMPVCAHDLNSYFHLVKTNSKLESDHADDDYESLLRTNKCLCKVDDDSDDDDEVGGVSHHDSDHREPEDIPENDHKLYLL